MQTTLQVTRGQRNDPFPVYIPPVFLNEQNTVMTVSSGNRSANGRLADYFEVKDTKATTHSTERVEAGLSEDANSVDQFPFAARGGRAVYPAEGDVSDVPASFQVEVDGGDTVI